MLYVDAARAAGYRDAYNRRDAVAIARHFARPSMLADRDCVVWATPDQIAAAMERLLETYKRGDFERADFIVDGVLKQGDAAGWFTPPSCRPACLVRAYGR